MVAATTGDVRATSVSLLIVPYRYPRSIPGRGAIPPDLDTIHEHTLNAFGDKLWLLEASPVNHAQRIEKNNVRLEARPDQSPTLQFKPGGRQRSHLPNRFRKR